MCTVTWVCDKNLCKAIVSLTVRTEDGGIGEGEILIPEGWSDHNGVILCKKHTVQWKTKFYKDHPNELRSRIIEVGRA